LVEQRYRLSKRLRAIYMLGDEGLVRAIFSSTSSQELDQTLKYLNLISQHDMRLINEYEKTLSDLNERKQELAAEVKHLMELKKRIQEQEKLLAIEQRKKSSLLKKLKAQREKAIAQIRGIQRIAKKHNLEELIET